MFRKFFSVQKMLEALFDEGWCQLGLPESGDSSAVQWNEAY